MNQLKKIAKSQRSDFISNKEEELRMNKFMKINTINYRVRILLKSKLNICKEKKIKIRIINLIKMIKI